MGGVDSSWLMARVEIRGLHKEFEGTVAVENLDLEVKDKEFVVLLGPSGCGKTTTLRCIAGLESPSEGEIYIGDRLVNDLEPKERNVADRKSTRLNSSHTVISYAVFCLKKK